MESRALQLSHVDLTSALDTARGVVLKRNSQQPRASAYVLGGEKREDLGRAPLLLGLTWRAVCWMLWGRDGERRRGPGCFVSACLQGSCIFLWSFCICLLMGGLHLSVYIWSGTVEARRGRLKMPPYGCLRSSWCSSLNSVTQPVISVVWCPAMSQLWDFTWLLLTELLLLLFDHEVKGEREVLWLRIQKVKLFRSIGGQTFLPVPCMYFFVAGWKKRGCEWVQRDFYFCNSSYEQVSNCYLQRVCTNVLFPT